MIFQAANGYIISGTVIGPNPNGTPGNIPLQGITVSAGGYSTTTAGDGTYALPPLVASTYLVTAADPNAQYATMTASVPLTTADAVANFTLPFKTYTLSGTLRDSTGHGVPSITVTATLAGSTDPPHTTLSGANGVYTFSGANGLRRGQYTITPDPAQWAWKPSSTNVNLAADTAGIDFAGARLYTVVMPTGLSLIGLPLEPTSVNPETAFGVGAAIARYDPTAAATQQPYAIYVAPLPGQPPVVPSILEVHAGRGFWVRQPQQGTDTTRTINVPGVLTPDIPFNLSLAAGWNMVANPFAHDIPWSFTQIATGGSVRDYAYVYSQALGYQLVTRTVLPGALSVLPQNAGMWMRASAATTVRVTALVGQSSASDTAPVAAKREAGDYAIQISATCGGLRDQSAVAGIMKAAGADGYRFEKPPAIGPAVNVFFPSDAGTRLGTDVRGSGTGAQTWNFTVAVDTPNAPVTVGLPDLSTVPNNLRVTLTDVDAGKTVYARTMSGYTYNSGEGGDRHFTLTVAPATAGGLVVTAASAQQVSGGAQIVYTLSRPASVTVSIMNIAGRTVRTLGAGSVQTAGVNVANWNLRSDAGASVPAGRYLVQIQAVADDGQKVQALSQLNVAK